MNKRAVLIAGPTASGKSGFAIALAKKINGHIINADSMQVYEGLRVLTARPSPAEEKTVPHHLYGHVPAATRYSVGSWLRDVETLLPTFKKTGKTPIFVGGTGLYFKALTEGLATLPEFTPEQFNRFVTNLADLPTQSLQKRLKQEDPVGSGRIERGDRQRTLRALMVLEVTGQNLSDWQQQSQSQALLQLEVCLPMVLMPQDRAWLYSRIDTRFAQMVNEDGGAKEAHALLAREISPDLPLMRAIGMPHFYKLATNNQGTDMDNVVSLSQRDTRRYAKRQMTWFRNQMDHWPRLDPMIWEQQPDKMLKDLDQIAQELEEQG